MSIVLLGYRGSGKTTIGRKLADRLWWKFVDTDDLIIQKAGKSIKEIFEQNGEAHFRDLETAIVTESLKFEDHVISLGGGAAQREENRQALLACPHKRVYLRCDPQVLYTRIHTDPATAANRPNLTALGGGLEEIQHLLEQREPNYRAVATAELDVTNLTPEEATVYIVRLL